ncbi:hypothetical protein LWI29_025472 [Acer saccharum]|uniref:Uncharacterized protein n=1 Tax=Acer saccharum TaxID=4024 RepID=A0AA39S1S7_ACESA|nr:hypothetical protein LWI29_025472 [Acer saccharum]
MDPSLRSSLFNRMMQAMELGDKCTADKIESLIRNFHPDSPIPISVFVPSSEDDFIPNVSPLSSNSDSPVMPRSSKLGGNHQRDRLHFSLDRSCSFDTEVNVVSEEELRKYKSRFDIPDSVTLMLPGDRTVWNPPENAVAIYGAMLSCGLKGYGPLTPREIRHFYTLRQAGNGGTYFLLSLPVENWIPEGVANPGQVEISSDEKKKGFI